jgi:hypothetical protein
MNRIKRNYKTLLIVFNYGNLLYQEGIQRHGESFEKAVEN